MAFPAEIPSFDWTTINGGLVLGQHWRKIDRQRDYLRGLYPGLTLTLSATALIHATRLVLTEPLTIPLDRTIPEGTRLDFGGGLLAITSAEAIEGDPDISVQPLAATIASASVATYSLPVELDSDLVAPALGALAAASSLILRNRHVSSGSAFRFLAKNTSGASALDPGDTCELLFQLINGAGSTENLALIRFKKPNAPGTGGVLFFTYNAGSLNSTPSLALLDDGTIAVNDSVISSGDIDVNGDLNALAYLGIAFWDEVPTGTQAFAGDAYATTWESTIATGTAPLAVTSQQTVANLNADNMSGLSWGGNGPEADGTATIAAASTLYTIDSVVTTEAGLYAVEGEASITVAALDVVATFYLQLTGAAAEARGKVTTSGKVIQLGTHGQVSLGSGVTVYLKIYRTGGTGTTSAAAGSLAIRRIGAQI